MRTSVLAKGLGLLFAGLAKAAPAVGSPLDLGPDLALRDGQLDLTPRGESSLAPRVASTCNTPSNRACWTNSLNINTDYETTVPTGIVRPVS